MDMPAGTTVTRAWRPPLEGVREVFHATFGAHAYPPHVHDVWTVFIVDDGAIRYDLAGRGHGAGQARVSILPPHVVHDGRPATAAGFRKRVLYLETSLLDERLIGAAVDRPAVPIARLRDDVAAVHDDLVAGELLAADTRLAFIVERIRASLGEPPTADPPTAHRTSADLADRLRVYLDSHLGEPLTMRMAADALGAGPTTLARAFSAAFGIAPHAYLLGRRLEEARDRILDGVPLADVAAELGFADQAHLTRRFGRFLGTTPGRFRDARPLPTGRRE
jgi:AraC-like DNA-binding protein